MDKNVSRNNATWDLIVNADDFGLSAIVNNAIDYSFKNGIINSTSLMTNTPAFVNAVEMAKSHNYSDKIGVHVNLTEGRPLTNFGNKNYLNDDGTWNKHTITHMGLRINKKNQKEFYSEILAQVQAVENAGIVPAHINSHHHVHTLPALFPLFLKISKTTGYKLRIAQTNFSGSYLKAAYRKYINRIVKKSGIKFSDFFETPDSFSKRKSLFQNSIVEIMVHPSFDESGNLIDIIKKDEYTVPLVSLLSN